MRRNLPLPQLRLFAGTLVMCMCVLTLLSCMENVKEESFPWPMEPVDAVYRALLGIEGRNWDLYASSFEPTTILTPTHPGVPGKFLNIRFEELGRDERQAVVRVTAYWEPSSGMWADDSGYAYVDTEVLVVRAKKPVGGKLTILEGVNAEATIYEEGWYIRYDQVERIPFTLNDSDSLIPFEFWSPPGWFAIVRDGNIWLQAAYWGSTIQLTHGALQDAHPSWSPNYNKLGFFQKDTACDSTRITRFCTIDPQGTHLACTSDAIGDVDSVMWSPNGDQLIAYNLKEKLGQWERRIQFFADDGLRYVTFPTGCLLEARLPEQAWSSDGRSLLVMLADGKIGIYDTDGSTLTELAETGLDRPDAWWAADGKWVVYTGICTAFETHALIGAGATRSCLRAISKDGSDNKPLAIGRSWQVSPAPSGPWLLAAVETESGSTNLLLIDVIAGSILSNADAGIEHLVIDPFCGLPSQGLWSPNGQSFFTQEQSGGQATKIYIVQTGSQLSTAEVTLPWRVPMTHHCVPLLWSSDGALALSEAVDPPSFPSISGERTMVIDIEAQTWQELSRTSYGKGTFWIPGTHWTYTIRIPPPDNTPDGPTPAPSRPPKLFLKNADTGEWRWANNDDDIEDSEPVWGNYETD